MNKSELKNGLVAKLSSGFKYLIIDNDLTNVGKTISLNNYNETLKDISGNNLGDIIEIYKIKKVCRFGNLLNDKNLELIWKREEEIDWDNVPVGTKVLVRDFENMPWREKVFICKYNHIPSSFKVVDASTRIIGNYIYCKLKEDI